MNTRKIEETKIESIEPVEEVETKPEPQEVTHPKTGWFFPNQEFDLPFGGEFETLEEAEAANRNYLETHKKEQK